MQEIKNGIDRTHLKWQRKKVNPSLSGLRSITVPKFSVVTITGKMKDIDAE